MIKTEENYSAEEKKKLAGIEPKAVAYPAGGYNLGQCEIIGAVWHPESIAADDSKGAAYAKVSQALKGKATAKQISIAEGAPSA